MSDPRPDDTSSAEPDTDGAADNSGGIEANQVNPEVPWVDPTAD